MENKNDAKSIDDFYNSFYLAYKDMCPCWPIAFCALLMASISVFGLFFNTFLILVTVLTKSLHGTANVFLALCALFESLHELGHFFFLSTALSGQCFVPYQHSFRILALSLFGLSASTLSMLFIGIDRLFCVIVPIKYYQFKFRPYIAIAASLCAVPSVFLVALYWQRSDEIPTTQVTGNIGDLLTKGGFAYSVYSYAKFACTSATILLYIAVAFLLRLQQKSNPSFAAHSPNRRIFRSLLLIVLFNIGGYFMISVFYMLLPLPNGQPITFWFLRMLFSIASNLSGASNAPILFATSFEYQKAFKRQFQRISFFILSGNRSAVQPTLFMIDPAKNQPLQATNGLTKRRATLLAESAENGGQKVPRGETNGRGRSAQREEGKFSQLTAS